MGTEEGFTPRAVKGTISDVTVTVQLADFSGFEWEATVMMAVPGDFPVTIPSGATVAKLSSLEVHVNDLSVAFSGVTATVSCRVAPVATDTPPSARRVTPSTATVTVTVQLANFSGFEWEAAVMIAVPADFPVTTPSATVAMLLSLEFHVRDLSAAFSGVTVAFSG